MSVTERIDNLLARLKMGDAEPAVAAVLSYRNINDVQNGGDYINAVINSLEEFRLASLVGPSAISGLKGLHGIGRYMMEDMTFCESELGQKIIILISNILVLDVIQRSLYVAEYIQLENIFHQHLPRIIELLKMMKQTFDENLCPDEERLAQLKGEMTAYYRNKLFLRRGELWKELQHLI